MLNLWRLCLVVVCGIGSSQCVSVADVHRCTKQQLQNVEGWIFDVTGTLTHPDTGKLLPGVGKLFQLLGDSNSTYSFVSNGLRTATSVSEKLSRLIPGTKEGFPSASIRTAGDSMGNYMTNHVPRGSKILALGTKIVTANGEVTEDLPILLRKFVSSNVLSGWTLHTDLSWSETRAWADEAVALGGAGDHKVCVLLAFGDGELEIDFELIKKASLLLRNQAEFIVAGSETAWRQPVDAQHPDIDNVFPTIGGFEALFLTSAELFSHTRRKKKFHVNVGKGGNRQSEWLNPVLRWMRKQKPSLNLENVILVGDDLGTDIKAGNEAGLQTLFVTTTGVHGERDIMWWDSKPSCTLTEAAEIARVIK